jgi:hypothetical protein
MRRPKVLRNFSADLLYQKYSLQKYRGISKFKNQLAGKRTGIPPKTGRKKK